MSKKRKSYDDYEDEGLFKRFEKIMDLRKAKHSDDIIRYFGYFQDRAVTVRQKILLREYAKRHNLRIYKPSGISVRKGKSREELKRRYVAVTYHTKKGIRRHILIKDKSGRFIKK